MGLLDNMGGNPNLTKGAIAVLGALLAGKLLSDRIDQPETGTAPAPAPQPQNTQAHDGGGILSGGLGGLLDKLRDVGHGSVADSWVQPGENKPIAPQDLGKALGQNTLGQLAARAGLSEDELLNQLSQVLPGLVDKLTPGGRVPSNAEVASTLGTGSIPGMPKSPW